LILTREYAERMIDQQFSSLESAGFDPVSYRTRLDMTRKVLNNVYRIAEDYLNKK